MNSRNLIAQLCLCLGWLLSQPQMAGSQAGPVLHQVVKLQDPSRPPLIKVSLTAGSLVVSGYDGQEVVVEPLSPSGSPSMEPPPGRPETKMMPPDLSASGLKMTEADNVVDISLSPAAPPMDLRIRVPSASRLKLQSLANGDLRVERITGEVEANLVNGNLVLSNIAGAVVAHTVNGRMSIDCALAAPDKPMVFSSVNGGIHIAFPSNLKANLKLETMNGRIESDFALQGRPSPNRPRRTPREPTQLSYPSLPGKTVLGPINGGGPEITVRSINGSIQVRKRD
jgi:hypothetical protein